MNGLALNSSCGSRCFENNSWENFMSTVLLNTEISGASDEKLLGDNRLERPNVVMKERQKMVRNQALVRRTEICPHPTELKVAEAKKFIREENLDRLIKEKEERIVKRAISQLEQSFFYHRKAVKLGLIELEKREVNIRANAHRKRMPIKRRNGGRTAGFNCKVTNIHRTGEKDLSEHICEEKNLLNVHLACQKAEGTAIMGRSTCGTRQSLRESCKVSTELKEVTKNDAPQGNRAPERCRSPTNSPICDPESGNREKKENNAIEQIFSPTKQNNDKTLNVVDAGALEHNLLTKNNKGFKYFDRWNLVSCWKIWRKFVIIARKDKEKLKRQNKIDLFVKRLTDKSSIARPAAVDHNNVDMKMNGNVKHKQKVKLFRHKTRKESEDKSPELQKLEKEIHKSSQESYGNLEKGLKNFHPKVRPKAKAMMVLAGGKKRKDGKAQAGRKYPVPDILLRMEARYKERKERWENIEKRKKRIEEEKREIEKEREEEKRRMEELKKKKDLEEIKERRRLRKEMEEKRKNERLKLRKQLKLAEEHYLRYVMMKVGFRPWHNLVETRRAQLRDAIQRSEFSVRKLYWDNWQTFVKKQTALRHQRADEFCRRSLLKKTFRIWVLVQKESMQRLQVADDWADAKHTEKIFRLWLAVFREGRRLIIQKEELANAIIERKIKSKYLRKWKGFPQLMKREKEKEKRKQLWRRKVQEFLPDYQPSLVCDKT